MYNYAYDKLTLLKSISIEKCVLQAKLIAFRGAIVIVCGATDGLVRIYNHSTGDSQSWKAHDSGIDSMSIRQSENSIEIMTGGDDGAICLCHWDGETHEMITRLDIHGSNVRGVSCQDLFSVSTDQRLYKYDSKLEIVQTAIVDVPDVSSFAVSQQHIAIVGHGMQIIEYI